MSKQKKKINPLYIKDANFIMFNLLLNMVCLYGLSYFHENKVAYFFTIITYICIGFCFLFGTIICIGWIIAIATKNVVYIEVKPKEKETNKNGNDNH